MSMIHKNAKSPDKTSGSSPRMSRTVCGRWSWSRCTVYLGQSARMCRTLRCTSQVEQTGGGFPDRRWPWVRRVWPIRSRVTTSSRRTGRLEDLQACTTGFTSRSLLSHVQSQSQSPCHLAKTDWRRAVPKTMLMTPAIRVPWRVAYLAAAAATDTNMAWYPGYSNVKASFKKSMTQLMHSSSISGCVRLGVCTPWISLKKSVHSWNCPGGW
jgi:hypothetical protein